MSKDRLAVARQDELATLRETMRALSEGVRQLDIREYEALPPGPALEEFAQRMKGLVGEAVAVAVALQGRYESGESQGSQGSTVADVAFMALVELRQRLLPIEAPATGDVWERVGACASGLRCIVTSLVALDAAICAVEHLPPVLDFRGEVETSLKIRRLYRKLWRVVTDAGEVGPAEVRARLRGAGTVIAMVVGRNEYGRLRGNDRLQLSLLQRRILAWMSLSTDDARTGVRLWEDFAGFTRMLRQVSLRHELMRHDQETLQQVWQVLQALPPRSLVPADLGPALRRLEGLDDALDALLDAGSQSATAVLREVERLQGRFARPPSPAAITAEAL